MRFFWPTLRLYKSIAFTVHRTFISTIPINIFFLFKAGMRLICAFCGQSHLFAKERIKAMLFLFLDIIE